MISLHQIFIAPIEGVMAAVVGTVYTMTGSHGFSIVALSLLINIVLFPLFQIAEQWQEAERRIQAFLRPKLQEFRQAFSGEERHAMTQTLYRQIGYHPIYAMRSSVGLFLQLPFWIAAYGFLSRYQPMQNASFVFIKDLSQPDQLLGTINLLPVLMTVLNLAAALFYSRTLDLREKLQPLLLATVFLWLLYDSPAGLLLYWTCNSLLSLLRIIWTTGIPTSATAQQPVYAENSDEGSTVVATHGSSIRWLDPPLALSLLLFVVTGAIHTAMYVDRFIREGAMLAKNQWTTPVVVLTGTVIVLYLCMAFALRTCRTATGSTRQQFKVTIVFVLCLSVLLFDVTWVIGTVDELRPARNTAIILLLLSFFLFAEPLCNRMTLLRGLPDCHWLYCINMTLLAFAILVANPIYLYVYTGDFVGNAYSVAGLLLLYFLSALLVLISLYALGDGMVRKCLTVFTVFCAFTATAYSALGVKGGGLMVQFPLLFFKNLSRSNLEILVEAAFLVMFLAMTTYGILHYRTIVTRVSVVMLLSSVFVAAVDARKESAEVAAVTSALPADSREVLGFSREQNVLIIVLDGFSGGSLETMLDQAPEMFDDYEGFVWYPNTVTIHAGTLGALPALAGGHSYTVQQMNQRIRDQKKASIGQEIREAYKVYADAFGPKGYAVSYVHLPYSGNCADLQGNVHCVDTVPYGLYYHDKEEPNAPLLGNAYSHLPPILTMVSVFYSSPFFLKEWIYDEGRYLGGNSELIQISSLNTIRTKDWGFLRVLARESNVESPSKTFKFIHLDMPHGPHAVSEDCKLSPLRATAMSEMVCGIKEIGRLLRWMKHTGIYESTKIVVVSDHGWYVQNPMFSPDFAKTIPPGTYEMVSPGYVQPLLLVKDFGARGRFSRSERFLSNADVPAIVCAVIGGCPGIGPDPTDKDPGERVLTFSVTVYPPEIEEAPRFTIMESYEVRSSIFDPRNWTKVH